MVRPGKFWALGSKWVNGIEVSLQDPRLYRALTLPNQLQVLLVSDTKTEKAAAAMAIQVGHQSDPAEIPGLAHFLEHMLFLGTEKYPDETSYKKYLSAHGGRGNAYTSATDTNFYFEVGPAHLHGALDRFSQFFVAPLFTPSATEREMNAVDAENAKNYQNDARRLFQLGKSLANPAHPYHKFGTGNLHTLGHHPKTLGLDIRQELLTFYNRHYSANVMKLVVYGKEDLNTLEDWATSLFSPVVDKNLSPHVTGDAHPYEAAQQGRRIAVKPVKDLRTLELAFPLPSLRGQYLTKPQRVLSHLLGHEGPGSLLAHFKALGYANTLSAGVTKDFADWAQFNIKITLTPLGAENYAAITQACFHYLNVIRAAPPAVLASHFDEEQTLAMLTFRFRNAERPIDYVPWLTSNMQKFPIGHVISGPSILDSYDDALVRSLLALMTPERMRLTVVDQLLDTTSVEPWLHAPYTDEPLSLAFLDQCYTPLSDDAAVALHLPSPNPFIPHVFDLVPPTTSGVRVVRDDPAGRVWLHQGNTFEKPKTSVDIKWYIPSAYASPAHTVWTELFVACVKDQIAHELYDADVAGMHVGVTNTIAGVTLHVDGYSETLPLVLRRAVAILTDTAALEQTFPRLLEKLVRGYANAALEEPHQWASHVRQHVLLQPKWTVQEKLAAATQDNADLFLTHANALFGSAYMEAFCYGNVNEATALVMLADVERSVGAGRATHNGVVPARHVRLVGNHTVRERNQNPANPNAATHVVYQLGEESTELRAQTALLAHLVKVPCFSQLRTQEQLGYIVSSGQQVAHGVVSFYVTVQSNKHSPVHLQARIDAFAAAFCDHLAELPVDQFQKHKDAVVAQLLEAPKTYDQESGRLWGEIAAETYEFDRRTNVASAVRVVRIEEIARLFESAIADPTTRHRLSIQIVAPTDTTTALVDDDVTITDIAAFKRRQSLFPARQKRTSGLAKL
ncbi:Aste57867_14713 [Aphanomyces stellatus]|uniref:Aste57867_14713 protein n=1 Tax=Aphanomyces stellatus TaxID=120398 RepID=A0A485L1E2_9STRA|nr:hypothetical protein As57867_014658 [Aphanomyces stellatus]VFT91531.1 Aste57867_14713 [Aphanomyces stellatus]